MFESIFKRLFLIRVELAKAAHQASAKASVPTFRTAKVDELGVRNEGRGEL